MWHIKDTKKQNHLQLTEKPNAIPFKSSSFSGKFCPGIYEDCVIATLEVASTLKIKEKPIDEEKSIAL